jgi:hypothetical protein
MGKLKEKAGHDEGSGATILVRLARIPILWVLIQDVFED